MLPKKKSYGVGDGNHVYERLRRESHLSFAVWGKNLFCCISLHKLTQIRIVKARTRKALLLTVGFLIFADSVVLIINVFHELILRYQYHADAIYAIR